MYQLISYLLSLVTTLQLVLFAPTTKIMPRLIDPDCSTIEINYEQVKILMDNYLTSKNKNDIIYYWYDDLKYKLYSPSIVRRQLSQLPSFYSTEEWWWEWRDCDDWANLHYISLKQSTPGILVLKVFGQNFYELDNGTIKDEGHYWLMIPTDNGSIIEQDGKLSEWQTITAIFY